MTGFSDNYLQVRFPGTSALTGKICRVKLTKADINTSEGELVRVLDKASEALA